MLVLITRGSTALAFELRTIDYIAGVGFILVALFVVALSLYEVGSARSDPDTYERVYHMTAEEYVADQYWRRLCTPWRWRSPCSCSWTGSVGVRGGR